MPVQYSGVIKEHHAVRNAAGLFDVSHMGEIEIKGPKAFEFLQNILTNDIAKLSEGRILYTVMCYNNGGIVDDLLVHKIKDTHYMLCVNASNTNKDYQWILKHQVSGVEVLDISDETAQLALQGPASGKILQQILNIDLDNLKYFYFIKDEVADIGALIARSGYTGEDGFEIYFNPQKAECLFTKILEIGSKDGIMPIGLAARDTLRVEMGYSLYGHEIDQNYNPLEANLGWIVKLDKGDFIGREALIKIKEEGLKRKLIGFEMIERGIPRTGYKIFKNNEETGAVVSGTFSPSLKKAIGTGYISSKFTGFNEEIEVDIRGKKIKGKIVKIPFYSRQKSVD